MSDEIEVVFSGSKAVWAGCCEAVKLFTPERAVLILILAPQLRYGYISEL